MASHNMILTLGLSNYLAIEKFSAGWLPNSCADGSWLVYFVTPCHNIHLSCLGALRGEVRVLSFILSEKASIRDAERANAVVGHPEIRIIQSSGLYVLNGVLRCEMAFVGLGDGIPNIPDLDVPRRGSAIRCDIHEVPICESF